MIELKHVSKQYDHPVIKDVNLNLQAGNIYVLKGSSGSGKSTLLHLLGGLDQAYTGEIIYQHKALKSMDQKEFQEYKSRIGFVFQESLLIPQFTVMENLAMFCEDKEKILSMAEQFQITAMLEQTPEKLSNGERQRISIIRCLLLNPSIVLMDEPTAALDQKNAYILQKQICALKAEHRILLISTHDTVFDEIADVILHMAFGMIEEEQRSLAYEDTKVREVISVNNRNTVKLDIQYCLNKYHFTLKQLGFLCVSSLIFLLIYVSFSFTFNFQKAYEKKLETDYPYEVFSINKDMAEERLMKRNGVQLTFYENYQKEYEDYAVLSYLPKDYSSLAIPQALSIGNFPENDQEVIVNREYIKQKLDYEREEDVIDTQLMIEHKQYTISGILTDNKNILYDVFSSNIYYEGLQDSESAFPLIFMSETAISSFVQPKDEPTVMARLSNEKLTSERYQELALQSATSYFYRVMSEKTYAVKSICYLIQFCIVLLGVITFIFMYYVIQLDLFHRKRELGYLQILHISKKRIKKMIRIDYLLKVIPSLVLSILLYMISVSVIRQYMNFPLAYDPLMLFSISFGLILYVLLLVELPLCNHMKRDVLSLIKE